jgi:hypothetical protein
MRSWFYNTDSDAISVIWRNTLNLKCDWWYMAIWMSFTRSRWKNILVWVYIWYRCMESTSAWFWSLIMRC